MWKLGWERHINSAQNNTTDIKSQLLTRQDELAPRYVDYYLKSAIKQSYIFRHNHSDHMDQAPAAILDLLSTAATSNAGITTYSPNGAPSKSVRTTYADFQARAQRNAQLVHQIPGISPRTVVLLHFDRHSDNLDWFWATIVAGYLPALSTPLVNDLDQRQKHLAHLHSVLEDPIVLTTCALIPEFSGCPRLRIRAVDSLGQANGQVNGTCAVSSEGLTNGHGNSMSNGVSNGDSNKSSERLNNGHVNGMSNGVSNGNSNKSSERLNNGYINGMSNGSSEVHVQGDEPKCRLPNPSSGQDIAVLMLTSGSTGNAKAVCLRHDQIIQSVRGKSHHLGLTHNDTLLNWIGMDHVANLIEMHLHAIYLCAEQVHVQAPDLLLEPLTFLRLVDKHRVSYTFAPNFFLASLKRALSGVDDMTPIDFDLSCMKILMCGGEANVVRTLADLTQTLHQFGAPGEFLRPGFGMTEICAAAMYGSNCPSYELQRGLEFSSVGTCIPGIEMRIMREDGSEAETGEAGHLETTGPIVFKEYYNNSKATQESFTHDGWFMTGDKAYIDDQGNLNLTGRSKETIIINGVKYFPFELETVIEESLIAGVTPSYTVVFPHRPKDSQTEEICIVYLPTYNLDDGKARTETTDAISHISMMVASARPYRIIPLTKKLLSKSSLGKLSRAKIQVAFEAGVYRGLEQENNDAIKSYRVSKQDTPTTETEEMISTVFCEMFDLTPNMVWVETSLFDYGITSIDLFAFKQRLQNRLALGMEIPVVMIMINPTIRGMAEALNSLLKGPQPYDPVIPLRTHGDKTPLWLVHPGTGDIFIFVNLAKYITDRPLYALRARGFEDGQDCFDTLSEAVEIYYSHIKKTQPKGPYAITGYSEGSILGFEIAKLLEADGDEVVFCGGLDTPPHVQFLIGKTDWVMMLIHVSYLLELTTREHAFEIEDELRQCTHDEALTKVLELATSDRREALDLSRDRLVKWVDVTKALIEMLIGYDPRGDVETMDVFLAKDSGKVPQKQWVEDHLSKWEGFTRTGMRMHECEGTHTELMTTENILSFSNVLKGVLRERGI